jgi:hypothetical protein
MDIQEPAQIIAIFCMKKFKAGQQHQKNFTLTSKYLTFAGKLCGCPIGGLPALKTEVTACLVSAYLNLFSFWLLL